MPEGNPLPVRARPWKRKTVCAECRRRESRVLQDRDRATIGTAARSFQGRCAGGKGLWDLLRGCD